MPNQAPEVTVFEQNVVINSFRAASDFFTATDPDGDPILAVRVFDFNDASTSGYWEFNGTPQANGSEFEIDFADLHKLFYIGGTAVGKEYLRIQVYDGQLWSSPENLAIARSVNSTNNIRPVPIAQDFTVLGNESVLVNQFVSAEDPDGYKIERYYIKDVFQNGSRLKLGNTLLQEGKFHYIWADQMDQLRFVGNGGGGQDQLRFFAYDGARWSSRGTVDVTIDPNVNRPVGQFNRVLLPFGDEVQVWPNVLWTDGDGNSAKALWVYDRADHSWSGELRLNGVPLAAKTWHRVKAADFGDLTFVGGSRQYNEEVMFKVDDGRFRSFNAVLRFDQVPRPEVASERTILMSHVESTSLGGIFDQLDDGPAFIQYEVMDTNDAFQSGYLSVNGIRQAANVVHTFSASQIANNVSFHSGSFIERSLDELLVRTFNGSTYSKWSRVNMRTEPNYDMALKSFLEPGNPNDWSDWKPPIESPPEFEKVKHQLQYSFPARYANYFGAETGEADAEDWGCAGIDTDFDGTLDTADGDGIFKLEQRIGVRRAFDYIEGLVNIEFVEVPDTFVDPETGAIGGQLRYGNYWDPDHGAAAFAFFPTHVVLNPEGGDMWYNTANGTDCHDWSFGTFNHFVHLHELGHALGQPHSFDAPFPLPPDSDNVNFTTMSYTDRFDGLQPHTYSVYDILNLQELYGANTSTNLGDDLYDIDRLADNGSGSVGRTAFVASIWDNGGEDTISAVGSAGDSVIDLRELEFSSIGDDGGFVPVDNVGIAFGSKIENAVGSVFNDVLTGNSLANNIRGGFGRDIIRGGGGDDILSGEGGSDRVIFGIGDGDDIWNDNLGAGRDTIEITEFPGLDFQTGISFWRDGLDLVLSLNPSGGGSEGTFTVENQAYGRYRMESLEIGSLKIDLTSVFSQATSTPQNFRPLASSTVFGQLVVPV